MSSNIDTRILYLFFNRSTNLAFLTFIKAFIIPNLIKKKNFKKSIILESRTNVSNMIILFF